MTASSPTETHTYWAVDPDQSNIQCRIKHFMISRVRGAFHEFDLTVKTEGNDFQTGEIDLSIKVKSLSTGVEARDAHLKSPDFLDAEKYPELKFQASSIEATSGNRYRIGGKLTVKDESYPVTIDAEYTGMVTDAYGNVKAGFNVDTKLNRKEIGLTWDGALQNQTAIVGNEIRVIAELVLVRKSEPPQQGASLDSLLAAYHTQQSQLPDLAELKARYPGASLYFQPTDVVGGDFYWYDFVNEQLLFILADATGHGIEGSMKAMLGVAHINEIFDNEGQHAPDLLLKRVHERIIASGKKAGSRRAASMLGMDMGVLLIDPETRTVQYSGAYMSLYHVRDGEITEYKSNRFSAGSHYHELKELKMDTLVYRPGDTLYMASDGLKDQYGGADGRKLGGKRFRAWLLEAADMSADAREQFFAAKLEEYKSFFKQLDDISVFGIRFQ